MSDISMETVYTALAEGIDRHGPEKSDMFLAIVCLLLAEELGNAERSLELIEAAQMNMKEMRQPAQ